MFFTLDKNCFRPLQRSLQAWEQYEAARTELADGLRRAQLEANRAITPGGQEVIEREFANKTQLLSSLSNLEPLLDQLSSLTPELAASDGRQAELAGDVEGAREQLTAVRQAVVERTAELQQQQQQWQQFYADADDLGEWMTGQQTALQSTVQSVEAPDEQLRRAEQVRVEVVDRQQAIGMLEQCGQQLTAGVRSRETTAANSRLKALRRQYEQLNSSAREHSNTLMSDVDRWNDYQRQVAELVPWMEQVEEAVLEQVPTTGSMQEASEQLQDHQV